MRTEDAFNALVLALTAYARGVPENSEHEVKITDLIKDLKTRESLLLLNSGELNRAAGEATYNTQKELRDTKPCNTFEITFQKPGKYRIVHLTLPLQR